MEEGPANRNPYLDLEKNSDFQGIIFLSQNHHHVINHFGSRANRYQVTCDQTEIKQALNEDAIHFECTNFHY